MEKKHIISLGGELASGKGTTSKILMETTETMEYIKMEIILEN